MKEIKIFLAHTTDVKDDVEKIRLAIQSKYQKTYKIIIEHWSDADKGLSQDRFQDRLNETIGNCEILYIFFQNRIGEYTKEEFYYGLERFKEYEKPYSMSIFFKELNYNTKDRTQIKNALEVIDFIEEIQNLDENQYTHEYSNIDNLENQLIKQLERDIKKITEIQNNPYPKVPENDDSPINKTTLRKEILFRIDELIQEKRCCEFNIRIRQDILLEKLIQSGFSEEDIYDALHNLLTLKNNIIQKDKIEVLFEDKYQIIEHISLTSYGKKVIFNSK